MLIEVKEAWRRVGLELADALWTSAALVFGKRKHGGKVVKFGPYVWCPENRNRNPE